MDELRIGVIGGTGLGEALAAEGEATLHELETPFGRPSDAIRQTTWEGAAVFLLSRHGPGHLLNPSRVPYRANIYALKQLGCTHILATGAVGSLREEYKPTDLVIVDQIIDKTRRRDATFFDHAAVHVEFAEPFDPVLRRIVLDAARAAADDRSQPPFTAHDRGCYVAMEGPAFSTRAESLMHRLWGGDLIGMTAMPEAKLAREAEMGYALIALVTDYDCWRQPPRSAVEGNPPGGAGEEADPNVLLKEILGNLKTASDNAMTLVRRTISLMNHRREELASSPALDALQLAIWSDKRRIPPQEIDRLRVLWGKYFQKRPESVDDSHRNASSTGPETSYESSP